MVLPLGESDHPDSPHYDDQAEKLFSKSRAKSTYFLNRKELEKHVTAKKRVCSLLRSCPGAVSGYYSSIQGR